MAQHTQNVLVYNTPVSQSSVATRLKCGGILMTVLSQIFLKCVSEKKLKSIENWQGYWISLVTSFWNGDNIITLQTDGRTDDN